MAEESPDAENSKADGGLGLKVTHREGLLPCALVRAIQYLSVRHLRSVMLRPVAEMRPWQLVFLVLALSVIFTLVRHQFYIASSADDLLFEFSKHPMEVLATANGMNGRFVSAISMDWSHAMGLRLSAFVQIFNLLSIVAFIIFSLVFACVLERGANVISVLVGASRICFHPFDIELLHTQVVNNNNFISLISLTGSIIMFRINRGATSRAILCLPLLFLGVAAYQTLVFFFVIFALSFALLRRASAREKGVDVFVCLLAVAGAFVLYVVVQRLTLPIYSERVADLGVPSLAFTFGENARSRFIPLADFPASVHRYFIFLFGAIFVDEPIAPASLKYLILASILVPIAIHALKDRPRFTPEVAVNIILFAMIVLASGNLLVIVIDYFYYPPRAFIHGAAVIVALLIAARRVSEGVTRQAVSVATAVIAGALMFKSAELGAAEKRVFDADRQIADRLYREIHAVTDDPADLRYSVIGRIPTDSQFLSGVRGYHAINRSRFTSPQSVLPMLSLAAGRRLETAPLETIPPARATCAAKVPYDGPAIIARAGNVLIVCLEDWEYYPGFAPRAFAPGQQ